MLVNDKAENRGRRGRRKRKKNKCVGGAGKLGKLRGWKVARAKLECGLLVPTRRRVSLVGYALNATLGIRTRQALQCGEIL
jgi:hypothetical protein